MQAHRLAALSAIVLYASEAAGPQVRDIDSKHVSPVSEGVSVLLFTRRDCPISNRYAPEIARLYSRFHSAGVRFWVVYADPKQSSRESRTHLREYGYPFQAIVDSQHALVRFTGVKITPEVAVYVSRRLVYRGRIDNRYISASTSRPAATVHDLEETLTNVVEGRPLTFRSEAAVGCAIESLQ